VIVTATSPLAHLLELGVKPHDIEPERKGGLATDEGVMIHPKAGSDGKIKHPGHRPQPFMRPAFDHTRHEVVRRVGASLGRGIEREAAKEGARFKGLRQK
jgi:hypothetical protein